MRLSIMYTKQLKIYVLAVLAVLLCADFAAAITDSRDIKNVGLDDKLGDVIPDGITLKDENGNEVDFKDVLYKDGPTVLSLVYFQCPRICTFASDGLLQVVNEQKSFTVGKDFRIITVSFDPDDTPEMASEKGERYRKNVLRGEPSSGDWMFLTGDAENIAKLTGAVGFKFLEDGDEFAHPSAIMVLTPDGKISRYLEGIQYEPLDFRLSLVEAAKGQIGTSGILNKVVLFCYEFDPIGKRYALKALNVVKAGGVITLLALCGVLTYFWRREKKGPE